MIIGWQFTMCSTDKPSRPGALPRLSLSIHFATWQPTAGFMIHVTCRLTAKNRDQLRNPTLGNRVWTTFTFTSERSSWNTSWRCSASCSSWLRGRSHVRCALLCDAARESNSVYVNGGVHITYSALCVAVLIRVQEVFTGAAQQRATYCERPITVCWLWRLRPITRQRFSWTYTFATEH